MNSAFRRSAMNMFRNRRIFAPASSVVMFVACVCYTSSTMHAQDWPQFRGKGATGVAADNESLPTEWDQKKNVLWNAEIPGLGWSCPVVSGNRVFVTAVTSDEKNEGPSAGLYLGQGVREPEKGLHHWLVYCFDLQTGAELWKHEAHTGAPAVPRHPKSSYAAETPVTDGERLYVLFGDLGLYCYDLEGTPIWNKEITPQETFYDYGAAASPVVHDNQVIVVYDNREDSWIAAFETETGEELWRTEREETHSWATPLIWENALRTEIVVPGKNLNRSYSLDGEVLWEFDGEMSNLVIPSPFAAHGMCYIASGYVGDQHRPTFAIKPGASGDISPKEKRDFTSSEYIEWYQAQASPYNTSQIVYGDFLYTVYDRGFITCHDAKTGKEVYGRTRFSPKATFTSAPVACNGYLYCLSEEGKTFVIKAGDQFEQIAVNDLDGLSLASPAISGDKLLIRTANKLYCIAKRSEATDR